MGKSLSLPSLDHSEVSESSCSNASSRENDNSISRTFTPRIAPASRRSSRIRSLRRPPPPVTYETSWNGHLPLSPVPWQQQTARIRRRPSHQRRHSYAASDYDLFQQSEVIQQRTHPHS